jgi:hypothetical protein
MLTARDPYSPTAPLLEAKAQSVTFTEPTLAGPVRDVATRLAPEDFEAVALLAERNAALDAQAEALGPVLARIEAAMQEVNAPRAVRDVVSGERLPAVLDAETRIRDAERALEAFQRDPFADAPELAATQARRDVAQAELDGMTGKRKASPRADALRAEIAAADTALATAGTAQEAALRRALSEARLNRGRAGVALNEAMSQAGVRDVTTADLVSLQADAVEQAARALEAGRPVPQPAAFTVRPDVNFDPVRSRADRVLRARPDLDAALQSVAKALDAGAVPDGPFARAFFADDAMTVPLPRDLAIDRITRAGERALSAEISGAPAWSLDGIAKLAERIDRPVSDRGLPRSALLEPPNPGTARVRTRIKGEAPARAQAAEAASDGLPRVALLEPRKLDMRSQRIINTVERELGELGDVRVELDGPDGRRITSAREMLARMADDEQALAALDACVTGSSSPKGDSPTKTGANP